MSGKSNIHRDRPADTAIHMRTCTGITGKRYIHAFIGEYAISARLEHMLRQEFGVLCTEGARIPDAFFEKYVLMAVGPSADGKGPVYVTSDWWYTCTPVLQSLGYM